MSLVLDSSTICKDKQFRVAYNQNDEITSSRQRVDNVQVCRTMFESSNVLENLVRLKVSYLTFNHTYLTCKYYKVCLVTPLGLFKAFESLNALENLVCLVIVNFKCSLFNLQMLYLGFKRNTRCV